MLTFLDFDTIWEQSDDNLSNGLPDDVPNTNDLPDDLPDAYDDRSSNDTNNGEFAWRRTDSTFIQNLYRLIELRSDTSTTGTGNILFMKHVAILMAITRSYAYHCTDFIMIFLIISG